MIIQTRQEHADAIDRWKRRDPEVLADFILEAVETLVLPKDSQRRDLMILAWSSATVDTQ